MYTDFYSQRRYTREQVTPIKGTKSKNDIGGIRNGSIKQRTLLIRTISGQFTRNQERTKISK